jgi:hypothetical protein
MAELQPSRATRSSLRENNFTAAPVILPIAPGETALLAADPNTRAKEYFSLAKSNYGLSKDEFRTLVKAIRNIVKDEGLISNFIDLHLQLNSLGMENKFKRDVDDRYKIAFNGFAGGVNKNIPGKNKGLDAFQRKFAYEWYTSGLIVTIERVGNMRMGAKAGKQITYKVPLELDILDPLKLDLDNLYKTGEVYYDLSSEEREEITKNGKNSAFLSIYPERVSKVRPTPDNPNPYQPKSKADILKLVQVEKKESVPLPMDRTRVVRRLWDDYTLYPVPFLSRALVALADKSLLREADRSVMSKLINQILTYKVGRFNNIGQQANVDGPLLQEAAQSFGQNLARTKDGRFMMVFMPDTHSLAWVAPDIESLLNQKLYLTANLELMAALIGFPAWKLLSETGDESLLLKMLYSQHDMFLNVFRRFVEEIYENIIDFNKMRFDVSSVNLKTRRISLFDTEAYIAFRSKLADKGWLSVKTALEDADEDFDTEISNLIQERDLRDQENILMAIPTYAQRTVDPQGKSKISKSRESPGRPKKEESQENNSQSNPEESEA